MPSNSHDKRLTIRFTQEEYALLADNAGDKPLSSFARGLLLERAEVKRKSAKTKPVKDHLALAQIMAMLGKSGVFSDVKTLADASKIGVIDLNEAESTKLHSALTDIRDIKTLLMQSLNVKKR